MALTRITSDGITDGSILNADLHNSADIAGTKISPDFGSQNIVTTGQLQISNTILNNTTNGSLSLQANGTGAVVIKAPNTSYDATLQLNCSQNTHGVKISAPPHSAAASYTLTLPSDIQNGKFLTVDSNGVTSWADPQLTASEILTLIKTVDGSGSGLDADTLDGISSASFLRSDAEDTSSARMNFNNSSNYPVIIGSTSGMNNDRLLLRGCASPTIQFREDDTDKAFIQWHSDGYFRIANQEDSSQLRVQDDIKFSLDGSTFYKVWHGGNDGASSGLDSDLLDGQHGSYYLNYNNFSNTPTIPTNNNQLTNGAGYITSASLSGVSDGGNAASLDGIDSSQFVRSDADDTINAVLTTRRIVVQGNHDIRLTNGNWTGNATKIQHHNQTLYLQGGTGSINNKSIIFRHSDGNDRWHIEDGGHFLPSADSTYDIGSNSVRVRNGYFDTLYGDGSNLSGVAAFPSGTTMLFVQSSAPTGWTKQTNYDNRALRIVNGSSGGSGAGSNGFTNVLSSNVNTSGGSVSSHTLSTSQIPSHSHSVPRGDVNWGSGSGNSLWGNNANRQTGSTGGGGSHSHSFTNPQVNLNIAYVDVIYASKD